MRIPAHIKKLAISAIFLFATFNFVKTTLEIIGSSKRLSNLESEVSYLKSKKNKIESEIKYRKSEEFIAREARNKLGMKKIGEELFMLPKVLGADVKFYQKKGDRGVSNLDSNFKLWLRLFL